ncbi:MAG TPA: hypothetical protein VEA63_12580, partial [Opitutus sp.]|nr:hypothetical protein [Opitutus sp.]
SSVGVTGALADPQIELFDANNARIPLGDEWAVPAATQATGANPLLPDSRDAAYVVWLNPGVYSAHIFSASGGSGDVVAEVYDIPEDTWLINPAATQPPTP